MRTMKQKNRMKIKMHRNHNNCGAFLLLIECNAVCPLQHGLFQGFIRTVLAHEFTDPVIVPFLQHAVQIGVFGTGYGLRVAEIIVVVPLYQLISGNAVQAADFLCVILQSCNFVALIFKVGRIFGFYGNDTSSLTK